MSLMKSSACLRYAGFLCYPAMDLREGSFTFLVGKSGCGKSTYLKLLNRTLRPEQGEITYQGKPIGSYPVLSYRREVLLVPQEVFLLEDTIRENFRFYYEARGEQAPSDAVITEFLRLCCIDFSPDEDCTPLSGGERQRVFLAVFLSLSRRVLLLDEPTSALDEQTAEELMNRIRHYCRERSITVLCVCHNRCLKECLAEEVIELEGCERGRA